MLLLESMAKIFGVLLLIAAVLSMLLLSLENQLIYFPSSAGDWGRPARSGGRIEEVELTSSDGVRLHGWYFPVADARLSVLYFHGNAGNLSDRGDWAERLSTSLRANLLLIDYRGYGKSAGSPDEAGLYRDAETAYRHLTETRGIPPGQVVAYGVSLGGAVATEVATRFPIRALILQSTFTSAQDMAADMYPALPVRWMLRTKFRTHEKLSRMTIPKLILHSTQDEVIPVWMAKRNHMEARKPKRLEIFEDGSGHNDLVIRQGGRLLELMGDFLEIQK